MKKNCIAVNVVYVYITTYVSTCKIIVFLLSKFDVYITIYVFTYIYIRIKILPVNVVIDTDELKLAQIHQK